MNNKIFKICLIRSKIINKYFKINKNRLNLINLKILGLMTIGSYEASTNPNEINADFAVIIIFKVDN